VTIPLNGLILAGGASTRMQHDKAALQYAGSTQLERVFNLARDHCAACFVSVRPSQANDAVRRPYPLIVDQVPGEGPIVGIRSAFLTHPTAAWLVLACDLPFLSAAVLQTLLAERDPSRLATAYVSAHDGKPEPLAAIWEPAAAGALAAYAESGGHCPRKFLMRHDAKLLQAADHRALDNVNTPEEYAAAREALEATG
jgi:molybdopterin-guanine dinucleotide biosynthesis protein A